MIAAAQSSSLPGDVAGNLRGHLRLAEEAARFDARVVVFPELSLTGYEPVLASRLAFVPSDPRLAPLQEFCRTTGMILSVGAPVRLGDRLHIGAILLHPNSPPRVYTKKYLHAGEEQTFVPGDENPLVEMEGERLASAVCADVMNPLHPVRAAGSGATGYLVGILTTPGGYQSDADAIASYAARYGMVALMANHGADSGGFAAAGRSAAWGPDGVLLASLPGTGEGLVIAQKMEGRWTARAREMENRHDQDTHASRTVLGQ